MPLGCQAPLQCQGVICGHTYLGPGSSEAGKAPLQEASPPPSRCPPQPGLPPLSVPPAPVAQRPLETTGLSPSHPSSPCLSCTPFLPCCQDHPSWTVSPGPFPGLWTQPLTSEKACGQGQEIRAWGLDTRGFKQRPGLSACQWARPSPQTGQPGLGGWGGALRELLSACAPIPGPCSLCQEHKSSGHRPPSDPSPCGVSPE